MFEFIENTIQTKKVGDVIKKSVKTIKWFCSPFLHEYFLLEYGSSQIAMV